MVEYEKFLEYQEFLEFKKLNEIKNIQFIIFEKAALQKVDVFIFFIGKSILLLYSFNR